MKIQREIIVIAHNIRSCHNVGSLFRTADGLGVSKLYLTGYTPFPIMSNDDRLPHEALKITRRIHKTALGAEHVVDWAYKTEVINLLTALKQRNYQIVALEQHPTSVYIQDFKPAKKIAIILGQEVDGIEEQILNLADVVVEIPMLGRKESFNVVQAAAMMLYACTYG